MRPSSLNPAGSSCTGRGISQRNEEEIDEISGSDRENESLGDITL